MESERTRERKIKRQEKKREKERETVTTHGKPRTRKGEWETVLLSRTRNRRKAVPVLAELMTRINVFVSLERIPVAEVLVREIYFLFVVGIYGLMASVPCLAPGSGYTLL